MKRATTGPPGEREDFFEVSYSGYPEVFGEPRIRETSGFEPNRQLVEAFQNGTAPSAISFRACYQNLGPVLKSAGPAYAAGAFRVSVSSPEIQFFI
jgi:hypothetical protein